MIDWLRGAGWLFAFAFATETHTKTKNGMHDVGIWGGGLLFFFLFYTSERHGGIRVCDRWMIHRRFDDGGGACEPRFSDFLVLFLLLYVMDDGDDGEIPRNKSSSMLENTVCKSILQWAVDQIDSETKKRGT